MKAPEIVRMGYTIQKYLEENQLSDSRPPDLMPLLVEHGYFKTDYDRSGLPLRNVLRDLDVKDLLYLLPQVRVERKGNRQWYFSAVSC
jgi:hypothetical protein